jgi:leader peptidase (prepilin peptidase) / N-methyltransferase
MPLLLGATPPRQRDDKVRWRLYPSPAGRALLAPAISSGGALIAVAPFVGSFLGLLAIRMPRDEPVVLSRSSCRTCGHSLGPVDLIPLVSWSLKGGRCRYCSAGIGLRYPLIELGALIVAAWSAATAPGLAAWWGAGLGWSLLLLALLDLEHFWLPDAITLPLVAVGLGSSIALQPDESFQHVAGAAAGALLFLIVRSVYRRLRQREGLGLGDVKLLAASGAWVALDGIMSVVLLASVFALAVSLIACALRRQVSSKTVVPFGTYLAGATWIVWLYGPIQLN